MTPLRLRNDKGLTIVLSLIFQGLVNIFAAASVVDSIQVQPVESTIQRVAPLYDGLIDASLTTGDPEYLASVIRAGRRARWRVGPRADLSAQDGAADRTYTVG